MTRKLPITLAAILAGSAFAFPVVQPASAEDTEAPSGQNDSPDAKQGEQNPDAADAPAAQFPAGIKLDDDPKEDQVELYKTLDNITEAAFTKRGFDDVVQRLVDQDRNRIGKDGFAEKKFDDLGAKVEALRTAWKDKYQDDFEVDGEQAFA